MTTPNACVILPAVATEEMMFDAAYAGYRHVGGTHEEAEMLAARRLQEEGQNEFSAAQWSAVVAAAPNSGLVTADMLEAAARAILKAAWEITGETPEDAALIADSIIDGIADGYEDDVLAARMAARAAFESIGLTVEG